MNKYWRSLPVDEYLHKMGINETNNAIQVSQFPESVVKWIWVQEKEVGAHFTKTVREI